MRNVLFCDSYVVLLYNDMHAGHEVSAVQIATASMCLQPYPCVYLSYPGTSRVRLHTNWAVKGYKRYNGVKEGFGAMDSAGHCDLWTSAET